MLTASGRPTTHVIALECFDEGFGGAARLRALDQRRALYGVRNDRGYRRDQRSGVSGSRPNSTRPVDCMTRGCTPMCCVIACTSRNARSSGQLVYSELAPPATYIRSTACTALLTA